MQLRISPGGRIRFSRRRRPELPPSLVTVTMAARSTMGRCAVGNGSWRGTTCCLRPRSKAESPVPPPRATTRMPRGAEDFLEIYRITIERQAAHKTRRLSVAAIFFRVQQFGKARIFLQEGEVFVVASVVAIGAA